MSSVDPEATADPVELSDQDFVMKLFDDGVMPQNQGGDATVPDVAFFDVAVYDV
ncbi:MAG TPA: hypothetical protein VFX70_04430 [Mycobacteriales bacterium]|nr:hypothetical protein [Mycobacteriales bacterium]